jgi:hypothetical protein
MNWIYEIDAVLDRDGKLEPFSLKISEPICDESGNDFYCIVHAPTLFNTEKKIYGADQEQAKSLALTFAKKVLSDKHLMDKEGLPIVFE